MNQRGGVEHDIAAARKQPGVREPAQLLTAGLEQPIQIRGPAAGR
jgi:hypothetical protein